jgi:hypothetical protein
LPSYTCVSGAHFRDIRTLHAPWLNDFKALLLVSTLLLAPGAALAQSEAKPAPLADLVKAVDIPYETASS